MTYLLPTSFAIIDLHISGSFNTNFTIQTSGTDKAIVTDSERISFNISDEIIKDCVKEYLGGRPDDAFIHGPTPWGDLYKTYGWSEAYRVLRPISSRIVSVASSPQMLKQQFIETNKTTEIGLSQTIYNRFTTKWTDALDITVKQINCHINVDNFKKSYKSALGKNRKQLKPVKIGVSITDVVYFEPVVVELYATLVSVKTEVVYQASLWGNFVLNYERKFRGHHFYSPNLEDIMLNCGLSNSLQVKEIIDVGFYMDAKIVVKNKSNGLMVLTRNMEI